MPSLKPNGKRLNGRGSKWITKPRRLAIYLRDAFTCAYCGANLHGAHPRAITLDHLRPQVLGGSHASSNLIVACARCNFRRQHRGWKQFLRDTWLATDESGRIYAAFVGRIERRRRRVLPITLAKAILAGTVSPTERT